MVLYECVLTTRNTAGFESLTKLMKDVSYKVVDGGGVVRSIQNHGIRDLPYRFKARYPKKNDGVRYYKQGRFVSIYYDASPRVCRHVENVFRLHEDVLRTTHLRARNPFYYVNIAREDKNPYIRLVKEQQHLEEREKENKEMEEAFMEAESAVSTLVDDVMNDLS